MTGSRTGSEKLQAGTIAGAYGIQGWVRVHALTDPLENFLAFPAWFVRDTEGGGGRAGGRRTDNKSGRPAPVYRPIRFEAGRRHGKGLVAKIEGIEDRTAAERLRGTVIWVDVDDLAPLDDGEFYWRQLEGLEVWSRREYRDAGRGGPGDSSGSAAGGGRDASGGPAPILLGVVDHLLETGANDVLVIAPCEGSIDLRERLVPYLPDDVVQKVDLQAGRIDVDWHPDD